jgi:general secretion pathway protein A
MYEKHFGFTEKPFELTPDPAFLYLSHEIRETIATLNFGILERRGFVLIVGEPGTGKTTMINTLMDSLDAKTKFAYVFNPAFDFHDLLQTVLTEFGLAKENDVVSKRKAIKIINEYAIKQYERGKTTTIIVDEAQYLDITTLENLRLLSNLETRKHKLIQIIIAGQPELEHTLRSPKLRQLTQRISLRRKTQPLNEKECTEYIEHRLKIAGYSGKQLFANRAKHLIFEYSKGIPRIINILSDSALLNAYATNKKRIDSYIIEEAIEDLRTVDVDADQKSEVESNNTKGRTNEIISKDQVKSLTDKEQGLPEEEQSLSIDDQEIAALITTGSAEHDDASDVLLKSESQKSKHKITFSRASAAVLIVIFIFNLGTVVFYFWGKHRYQRSSNIKLKQSATSALSDESEKFKAYGPEKADSMVKTLDDKLEGLYHKIESMKIDLEDKMIKDQVRQDEMRKSIEEKLKDTQERQEIMKISLEEKIKQNNGRQLNNSLSDSESIANTDITDNKFEIIVGMKNQSTNNHKYVAVKKGESLNMIILREYGKLDDKILSTVLKANKKISNPDYIQENQIIILPPAADKKFAKED